MILLSVLLCLELYTASAVHVPKEWIGLIQKFCLNAEESHFTVTIYSAETPTNYKVLKLNHTQIPVYYRLYPALHYILQEPMSFLFPPILVWSPLQQFSPQLLSQLCPRCASEKIEHELAPSGWTDGSLSQFCPRLLYGMECNVFLISRIYKCQNEHIILGHHPTIIQRLQDKHLHSVIPFRLWHRVGFTSSCIKYVEKELKNGISLQQIEQSLKSSRVERYYAQKMKFHQLLAHQSNCAHMQSFPEVDNSPIDWWMDTPSRHSLASCFLLQFWENEPTYRYKMECVTLSTGAWMSCDHTFKSVANIGLLRNFDNKWIKQYNGLFCTLNEFGEVMTWKLTKTLSFDNIKEPLAQLNERLRRQGKVLEEFYVDVCCSWRSKLKEVFGNQLKVKLDVFHAVQRITRVIPKRHPYHKECMQSLTFVFRQPSDHGIKRSKPTPTPLVLRRNLESFQKQWENISCDGKKVLPPTAIHEINCLLRHIDKGCLSDIEPGRGTNRNERMHRELNKLLSSSRYGVELSYALLTSLFYVHNEKIRAEKEKRIAKPISSVDYRNIPETIQRFGLLSEQQENDLVPVVEECTNEKVVISNLDYDTTGQHIYNFLHSEQVTSENDENESEGFELLREQCILILQQAVASFFIAKQMKSNTARIRESDIFFTSFVVSIKHLSNAATASSTFFPNPALPPDLASCNPMIQHLQNVLESWNFQRIEVPGDGNCLFYAISLALVERIQHGDTQLHQTLTSLGLSSEDVKDVRSLARFLRQSVVHQWLANTDMYQGFATIDLSNEANTYLTDGEFSGELGDLMVLTLANILKTPITLFTSIPNLPVLCIVPTLEVSTAIPLYLTYIQTGPGHYDYAIPKPEASETDQTEAGSIRKQVTTIHCTCGRKHGFTGKACSNGRCPCIRRSTHCTSLCRCKKCENSFGNRPNPSTTRRRIAYDAQRQPLCGKTTTDFMHDQQESTSTGYLNLLENLLLKAIFTYFLLNGISFSEDRLLSVYNNICTLTKLIPVVDFSLRFLTVAKITKFLKNLKSMMDILSSTVFLSQ